MGAAFLAGLAVGVWSGLDEVAATWALERRFEPRMSTNERGRLIARWRDAIERTKGWASAD
jgi:glycerol kinase